MSRSNRLFHVLVVAGASLTSATGCGNDSSVNKDAAQDAAPDGAGVAIDADAVPSDAADSSSDAGLEDEEPGSYGITVK